MRQLLAIIGTVLIFSACSRENNEPIRKFTSFQVDSQIVTAENPLAILSPANLTDDDVTNDYPVLNILAAGNHGEIIQFHLISETDAILPGTYSSDMAGNSFRIGYPGTVYNLQANYQYGGFQLTLTKVQDSLIEGSFAGVVEDSTGTISPRTLNLGFIRAVFRRDTI